MDRESHHERAPTAEEIDSYLTKDLLLRRARNEPADKALEANSELGLHLRDAVNARYAPPGVRTGNATLALKLIPAGIITLLVVGAAVVWVAISSVGVATIPYLALIAVLIACGYQQYRIENLELEISEINVLSDALSRRVNQLEAIVKTPERQAILDDFEEWRSSPTRGR
jgi:hypothetical protein